MNYSIKMRILLRWKNNGQVEEQMLEMDDNSPISTNFKLFRKYMLMNSGLSGDDVKISLGRKFGEPFLIQSEDDFQVALYLIKCRAPLLSKTILTLEPIVVEEPNLKNLPHSNDDIQTRSVLPDDNELQSLDSFKAVETPPEWFSSGLAQLKNELITHISIVADAVAELKKPKQQSAPTYSTSTVQIAAPNNSVDNFHQVQTETVLNHSRKSLSLTKPSPTVQTVVQNSSDNIQDFSRLSDRCPKSSVQTTDYSVVQTVSDNPQGLNKPAPKPTPFPAVQMQSITPSMTRTKPLPDEVNCRLTQLNSHPSLFPIDQCRMTINLTFENIRELSKIGGSAYRNFTARNSNWKLTIQRVTNYMVCYLEKYDYPNEMMGISYKMEGILSILAAYSDCKNYEIKLPATVFGKRNDEIMTLRFVNYINWGLLCDRKKGFLLKSNESGDNGDSLYDRKITYKLAFSMSIIKH